jgi:predicted metal-dependent hydrolase
VCAQEQWRAPHANPAFANGCRIHRQQEIMDYNYIPPRLIQRRDIDFGMERDIPRHWLAGDCHRTRFFDALSIMFPEGEKFFIDSVRQLQDRAAGDTELQEQVGAFIVQEALHRREHRAYNARLAAQGAPVASLEARVISRQARARHRLSARGQLAITICLEHFTAMLAHQILLHGNNLAGADERMASIWRWHAVEETEHKAVAFDLFTRVQANPVLRYLRRCAAMLWVTLLFSSDVWRFTFALVKADGRAADWRGWRRLLARQFVAPAPLLRIIPHWLAWFKPGFHPWQHDNRALLAQMRAPYDALARAARVVRAG